MNMQNQLALSGEIVEKVYPHLLHHVGLIREYLLRELNQTYYYQIVGNLWKIICWHYLVICTQMKKSALSELTNAEANILDGTKEYFWRTPPYLQRYQAFVGVSRRISGWDKCCYRSFSNQSQSVCYFPLSMMLNN